MEVMMMMMILVVVVMMMMMMMTIIIIHMFLYLFLLPDLHLSFSVSVSLSLPLAPPTLPLPPLCLAAFLSTYAHINKCVLSLVSSVVQCRLMFSQYNKAQIHAIST